MEKLNCFYEEPSPLLISVHGLPFLRENGQMPPSLLLKLSRIDNHFQWKK